MSRDKLNLVATACGILAVLFASIFFSTFRNTILIVGIGGILILATVVFVFIHQFSRALRGPRSLSGTRCRKCGKRRAMQEADREFLHGNVKFNFDHYRVAYRCTACGHEQEQEEHVDLTR